MVKPDEKTGKSFSISIHSLKLRQECFRIFDGSVNSFIPVADSDGHRDGEFTGRVVRADGEVEIVIIGGDKDSSSQIFNLNSMSWRDGNDLDIELWSGASVPYGDTFLLVGGFSEPARREVDTIYKYDVVSDRIFPIGTLNMARRYHTAVFVPDNFVDCGKAAP